MTSTEALLEVRGWKVEFPTRGAPVRAVRGIEFSIDRGETVGLVGESGSGKSVTVLGLLSLLPPTAVISGEAFFEGRDLRLHSSSQLRKVRGGQIGIIFQDPLSSLNPVLTIGNQIGEALRLHRGLRGSAARSRAVELLDLVGIADASRRLGQYPHELSGGMQQRVMIAAALACEPKLLIADEPTTALDVTIQAQILELLARLRTELGMAVLLITHDLGVVAGFADRVNVMYAGSIVETGDTAAVLSNPRHPYTLGLLRSVPRLDRPREEEVVPIPGRPPDLRALLESCAFAPRCAFAFDRCLTSRPGLIEVQNGRSAACWLAEHGPLEPLSKT